MDREHQENDPKLKLFLRLPRDTFAPTPEDEEFLKSELFRLLGDTTADRFMPRISKGHCFLFFSTRLLAAQAHDKLSNKVVKDYPLQPVFGFTREEQQAVDAGLQNKEIERNHRTLYLKGLPQGTTSQQLESRFSDFGEIEKVNIVPTKQAQVAFLVYRKFAPAHEAIEAYAGGLQMEDGVTATVELSKNKNLRRRVEKFQQQNTMGGGFGSFGGPRGGGFRGRGGFGGGFGGRGGYGGGWGGGAPSWGSAPQRGGWGSQPWRGGYSQRARGAQRGGGSGYGRGRGGNQGYGRGMGGPQRGGPSGGYNPRGAGGYGAGRGGPSGGGAYGGGRGASGGGAYGGAPSGGYGQSRGGWGTPTRGRPQSRGGGAGGWGSKSYGPY